MPKKRRKKTLEEWLDDFLIGRHVESPILTENKAQMQKWQRIKEVIILLSHNPPIPLEVVRRKVALKFLVTMRTALDYMNYARMILNDYWRYAYYDSKSIED